MAEKQKGPCKDTHQRAQRSASTPTSRLSVRPPPSGTAGQSTALHGGLHTQSEKTHLLRAAVDASADLIFFVDPVGLRYVDANHAAYTALGYSPRELCAMGPHDVSSKPRTYFAQLYTAVIAGTPITPLEEKYRCKDGRYLLVETRLCPLKGERGHIIVSNARDIGDKKRVETLMRLEHAVSQALSEADTAQAALKAVLRAICEAENWECGRLLVVDERAGVLRVEETWGIATDAIARFLQSSRSVTYAPGQGIAGRVWQSGDALWLTDVRKDPRAAQITLIRELGLGGAVLLPVRARGTIIGMLLFNSHEVREPDEQLQRAMQLIIGQVELYLQRKHAEEELRASEERFRRLCVLSSDLFWEQDEQYRFTSVSGIESGKLTAVQLERMLGKTRWELKYRNMSAEDWAAHKADLEAHRSFHDLELCWIDPAGNESWVSVSGEPVFERSGAFKGYRGVGKDITGRKRAEMRMEHLAKHDGLTALPNRIAFSEELGAALANARRYGRDFAVLFVDLDSLKAINDRFGHEAGDLLLREVSNRLRETVRAGDTVARIGGDEFVVLAHEVGDPQHAEAVAAKILSAVASLSNLWSKQCRVTASIGICVYPYGGDDEQSLMKNADSAMYQAKQEGGNRYKLYSAPIKP